MLHDDWPIPHYLIWVWLNIEELGLRRFSALVPFAKVPFWYLFFEPQRLNVPIISLQTDQPEVPVASFWA